MTRRRRYPRFGLRSRERRRDPARRLQHRPADHGRVRRADDRGVCRRTWGELRKLTADLPQQAKLELSHPEPDRSAAPNPPRPLPAGQSRRRLSPMLPILMIWLTVALTTGHPAAFIPVLIVLVILARLTSGGPRRR